MSLIAIYDVANASSFRNRLIPAVAQAAGTVLQEGPSERPYVDAKRRDLAFRALRTPEAVASEFVWAVLSNPTIASAGIEAPDADIAYQVNQVWSTIAGVTTTDEAHTPIVPEEPA